jgi:two-component system cell cycle response regulator DivK
MRRVRIFIVEDNELNRQLFHDVLELAGFEVIEAASVGEARELLRRTRPDLVMTDIQIPDGRGEMILDAVRQRRDLDDVPVVAVTAFAMHGDRERLLAKGFDGYLSKPIDTRRFAATIATFLPQAEALHVA